MKFIKVYSILLLIVVCNYVRAQMLYTFQTNIHTGFAQIINQPSSTNLLVTNTNFTYSPNFEVKKSQLLRLSAQGIVLDSLKFPTNYCLGSKIIPFNNYYYCYGNKYINYSPTNISYISIVYKIDQNLNIVQQQIIDTTSNDEIATHQLLIKNNNIYLGNAHINSAQIKIYKLTPNLLKLDSTTMPGLILCDMINYNNKLLISGAGMAFGSPYGSNQVAEMDTTFNIISRKNLDSLMYPNPYGCNGNIGIAITAANLFTVSANKYAVSGFFGVYYQGCGTLSPKKHNQNIIFLIENNKCIKNIKIIGDTAYDCVFTNINQSSCKVNNSIYNVSMLNYDLQNTLPVLQTTTTQILFSKTDTLGNTIWVKYFGTPNYFYNPYALAPTADSGFVISGLRYNLVNPAVVGAGEGFVMKLDKEGNQVFVGIKSNGGFNINYHKCYPNPNTGNLYFDFPFNEAIEIKIYDAVGKRVKLISNYESNSTIDIAEFTSGVYFYKATSKTKNYSGKFIKH